jgi:hypothetical protein
MTGQEDFLYKGCTLKVRPQGSGWKVFIYRPSANLAEATIPSTMEFSDREACIAEAKIIVDNLFKR